MHYVSNMENIRHFLTRGRRRRRGAPPTTPEAEIAVGADANFISSGEQRKPKSYKFNSGQ